MQGSSNFNDKKYAILWKKHHSEVSPSVILLYLVIPFGIPFDFSCPETLDFIWFLNGLDGSRTRFKTATTIDFTGFLKLDLVYLLYLLVYFLTLNANGIGNFIHNILLFRVVFIVIFLCCFDVRMSHLRYYYNVLYACIYQFCCVTSP